MNGIPVSGSGGAGASGLPRLFSVIERPLPGLDHEEFEQAGGHGAVACLPLLPAPQRGAHDVRRFGLGESCRVPGQPYGCRERTAFFRRGLGHGRGRRVAVDAVLDIAGDCTLNARSGPWWHAVGPVLTKPAQKRDYPAWPAAGPRWASMTFAFRIPTYSEGAPFQWTYFSSRSSTAWSWAACMR